MKRPATAQRLNMENVGPRASDQFVNHMESAFPIVRLMPGVALSKAYMHRFSQAPKAVFLNTTGSSGRI